MAARKFYQYAGPMIGLPNVVHFMLMLWLSLASHIALHRQQQQQQQLQQQSDDEGKKLHATNSIDIFFFRILQVEPI